MAEDTEVKTSLIEWLVPLGFIICAAWVTWHMPAYILDWGPPETESALDRLSAQFKRNDVTPGMGGVFGGYIDLLDLIAVIGVPVLAVIGIATVKRARMEQFDWNLLDKLAVFLGRVTMAMIVLLLCVMLYEVLLRYVFERPTLWANELSLWIAGFVFLLAGLYAMQQRSHIRIFIVYDIMPRWLQRACDSFSTLLIFVFAFALIWGGFGEAYQQYFRWETLGTAFDPPLPATLSPMILIVVSLVAVQSLSNLIRDWNRLPEHHSADEVDQEEIEAMKRLLGDDKNA